MAETFHFELISPERQLMAAELAEAIIPGQEGDLAAMPERALLIAQLRPGILTTRATNGEEKQFFLRGGFADVGPAETIVIAEHAVPLSDFSAAMLQDEIALAEQALEDATGDDSRFAAQDRLERLHSLQPRIAK